MSDFDNIQELLEYCREMEKLATSDNYIDLWNERIEIVEKVIQKKEQ